MTSLPFGLLCRPVDGQSSSLLTTFRWHSRPASITQRVKPSSVIVWLEKFTIAVQIGAGRKLFSRPVLRALVTYAN